MKSFVDKELTFTFKCDCGSKDFERPERETMKLVSFFEGIFECTNCKKEHDYCSNSFIRSLTQLELF